MADAVWVESWILAVLVALLAMYSLIDLAYFIRMAFTVLKARYYKPKACVMNKIHYKSWCFLNDIDTLLFHMNNARYLRELDFARVDFYERTGLYAHTRGSGASVVQAATTIRYRRFIKPATIFTITSKVVYWDDKTIFMEHEFMSKDGFVNAVATCRQRIIDSTAFLVMEKLSILHCNGDCKQFHMEPPEIPTEIAAWIECNEISSRKLRADTFLSVPLSNAEETTEDSKSPIRHVDEKPNGHLLTDHGVTFISGRSSAYLVNTDSSHQADSSAFGEFL